MASDAEGIAGVLTGQYAFIKVRPGVNTSKLSDTQPGHKIVLSLSCPYAVLFLACFCCYVLRLLSTYSQLRHFHSRLPMFGTMAMDHRV